MKTKSIASCAALLGAAVVLTASALAGPGPQPQFQARKVSEQVTVNSSNRPKPPTVAFGGTKSEPKLYYVSGGKGNTYAITRR